MKTLLAFLTIILLTACGSNDYYTNVPGPAGTNGTNGTSCSVHALGAPQLPYGGAIITCTDGTASIVSNGTPGINGTPGTPGTVIQPVQFCKNPVTTYPATFSEIGFCINGEIYAVYSANDGFLSPMPNGNYQSDGINSSCTFTITGCVISNQSN